jgi:catechol 2,3-dioxygenase-like lactoylglutathione lyase family enzyme
MGKLITASRFPVPDAAYHAIIEARRGLGVEEAAMLDAKLVLILANHIGDLDVLNEAVALAKGTGPTAGAVFSHVSVGATEIAKAMRFYDAVLAPLGLARKATHRAAIGYGPQDFSGVNPPFWVLKPYDRNAASPGNGVTVAFTVPTRTAVDGFHAAALAAGGTDEGAPGLRTHYHADYYAAYVRDPEGNKVCAVCHLAPAD